MLYNDSFLDSKRGIGDSDADDMINQLFETPSDKTALHSWLDSLKKNTDLIQAPEIFKGYPVVLNATNLPSWANSRLMAEGSGFFAYHAESIMRLLGLLSLPYCYAAAKGAMVLYLSERMYADTGKRLWETAGFIWDIMHPQAFEPEGKGFVSVFKVRLMHAAARYYTLRSGQWNDDWGVPVNQEDMAGTNLAFSLIMIRGLRKLGFSVSYNEQQSYMHLWNVTGSLLGLNEDLLAISGRTAFNLEEAIRHRHFESSVQGKALTYSLIKFFDGVSANMPFSQTELLQLISYLLGEQVCDILQISKQPLSFPKIALIKASNGISELKTRKNAALAYKEYYDKFYQAAK